MTEEATVWNMLVDGEYAFSVYAHAVDLPRIKQNYLIAVWPLNEEPLPVITFERVFDEDEEEVDR